MRTLDLAKDYLINFFSGQSPTRHFKAVVTVRNHAISFGPDNEEPRYLTNVVFEDEDIIARYGKTLEIDSVDYYYNTQIGDIITIALSVNPDYDETNYKSQKLILYKPR